MDSAITLNDYVYVRLTEHGQQVVRDARIAAVVGFKAVVVAIARVEDL